MWKAKDNRGWMPSDDKNSLDFWQCELKIQWSDIYTCKFIHNQSEAVVSNIKFCQFDYIKINIIT